MSGFTEVGVVEAVSDGEVTTAKLAANAVTFDKASLNTAFDAYAAGTVYSLTNAAAAITFGTTQPAITITTAGTYRLRGRINIKYNAATFVAARTITLKFRRTNNTAADLTNSSTTFLTGIVTTLTQGLGVILLPEIVYVTALATDALTIFGNLDTTPSAGSLDIIEASIHAQRVA